MASTILGKSHLIRRALASPMSSCHGVATKSWRSSSSFSIVAHSRPFGFSLRSLVALSKIVRVLVMGVRCFSTRPTTSSLNDSSPNWSNRPPKETILLDGCDFEHWLVVVEPPEGNPTRDEIINSYIKTLAQVFGS